MAYAKTTSVSVATTKAEIEAIAPGAFYRNLTAQPKPKLRTVK